MSPPLAGISAAEIAQQRLTEQGGAEALKNGSSKFDLALAKTGEAQAATSTSAASSVTGPQAVEGTARTEQSSLGVVDANATKAEAATVRTQATDGAAGLEGFAQKRLDPMGQQMETSKSTKAIADMLSDIERGQGVLDQLIKAGVSGKSFSSTELLALQAGMYKYTQELELTGKVVEKATTGLKDTLKTQV